MYALTSLQSFLYGLSIISQNLATYCYVKFYLYYSIFSLSHNYSDTYITVCCQQMPILTRSNILTVLLQYLDLLNLSDNMIITNIREGRGSLPFTILYCCISIKAQLFYLTVFYLNLFLVNQHIVFCLIIFLKNILAKLAHP